MQHGIKHNVTVKSGPAKFHSANNVERQRSPHKFSKKGTYHV